MASNVALPSIDPAALIAEHTIPSGGMWSQILRRHGVLRLTDLDGGANAGVLLFRRDQLLERLNLPDTLKAQHTARLTTGHCLYSDMGHVMASITADTLGWHDPLGGNSSHAIVAKAFGTSRFQEERNAFHRNGRDQFLIEMGKWGLGPRDLGMNVNFFSKVTVDAHGKMDFDPTHSVAGASVELRAEMDLVVILHTCPHPMHPGPAYPHSRVLLSVYRGNPPADDDVCRRSHPENVRGFQMTGALYR